MYLNLALSPPRPDLGQEIAHSITAKHHDLQAFERLDLGKPCHIQTAQPTRVVDHGREVHQGYHSIALSMH